METWPIAALQNPNISFKGSATADMKRTPMDSGRIRQRKSGTVRTRTYNAEWTFSDFQFGIFQSWVLYKITDGADSFLIDLPVGSGDGSLKTVTARIKDGDYDDGYDGVMFYKVSCTLEVDSIPLFSEAELDDYIAGAAAANPPRTQAFVVDLTEGDVTKDITYPVSFSLLGVPPGLKCQLQGPVDGYAFETVVVALSKTALGFTVNLGAAVPGPGYSLSIIASFDIT